MISPLNMIRIFCIYALAFLLTAESRADQIQYVDNGKLALSHIYQMFRTAKKSIDLTTFIFNPCDASGKLIMEESVRAAKRGVKVRLLVDSYTTGKEQRTQMTALLQPSGVELRFFNPPGFLVYTPDMNFRLHAKMIVVDSSRYLSGGRNIQDDYFSVSSANWVDRDVYVVGPSALQAQRNFDKLWNADWSVAPTPSTDKAALDKYVAECISRKEKDNKILSDLAQQAAGTISSKPSHSCSNIEFVVDDPDFMSVRGLGGINEYLSGTRYQKKRSTRAFIDFLTRAGDQIVFENYSFLPAYRVNEVIREKREKGTRIEIVTNDNLNEGPLDQTRGYIARVDSFQNQIFHVLHPKGFQNDSWSATPKGKSRNIWMLHSKVMTSSNSRNQYSESFVSSWNIDPRSYHTNIESATVVRECPALAQEIRGHTMKLMKVIDQNIKNCRDCTPADDSSFWKRLQAWSLYELL